MGGAGGAGRGAAPRSLGQQQHSVESMAFLCCWRRARALLGPAPFHLQPDPSKAWPTACTHAACIGGRARKGVKANSPPPSLAPLLPVSLTLSKSSSGRSSIVVAARGGGRRTKWAVPSRVCRGEVCGVPGACSGAAGVVAEAGDRWRWVASTAAPAPPGPTPPSALTGRSEWAGVAAASSSGDRPRGGGGAAPLARREGRRGAMLVVHKGEGRRLV